MSYAVLRIAKIKNMAGLGACVAHNRRTHSTAAPHADPAKRDNNKILAGGDSENVVTVAKAKIEACGKHRKDAVQAVEILMTASADFFATASKKDQLAWAANSQKWVEDTFGKENILSIDLHVDEKEPHIHALIVPIFDKKLRASHWLDGPAKLAHLQDTYAAAVEKQGLKRGEKGSKSTHTTLKSFYAFVSKIMKAIKTPSTKVPKLPERGLLGQVSKADWAKLEKDLATHGQDVAQLRAESLAAQIFMSSGVGDEIQKREAESAKRLAVVKEKERFALNGIAKQRDVYNALEPVIADLKAEATRLKAEAAIERKQALLERADSEKYRAALTAEIRALQGQLVALPGGVARLKAVPVPASVSVERPRG